METTAASSSRSHRVLVVDDYPDSADMLAEALEHMGHQVAIAHDGETALSVAAEQAPRIALLDLRLPRMDGFELATKLKQAHGSNLVLVAMTGLSRAEERARASLAGFEHYFVKPVDLQELEQLLSSLVR
ncbi:MAG TPA: response regulator [Polyangiaceae bacterium]|nr:response regulator [Polyangiaceae bacterium]